jgi:hypothetical protein
MNSLKPWVISGALMLGAGAAGVGTAVTPAVGLEQASPWIMDLEAAKTAARQSGKPIFLVFR